MLNKINIEVYTVTLPSENSMKGTAFVFKENVKFMGYSRHIQQLAAANLHRESHTRSSILAAASGYAFDIFPNLQIFRIALHFLLGLWFSVLFCHIK